MTGPAHENAARDLAALGYPVFPCKPRGKAPLTRQGFKAATRDERTILQWWDRWPTANIAISCGDAGVSVLDLDPRHGADPLEVLDGLGLDPTGLMLAWTGPTPDGQRGAHAYFHGAARTGPIAGIPGAEIRGAGAYVIAAPSIHPTGTAYEWATEPRPPNRLPPLPEGLEPKRIGAPPPPTEVLREGGRHEGLKAVSVHLVRCGVTAPDLVEGAILAANKARCRPPLPEGEVRALAAWAIGSELAAHGRHGLSLVEHLTRRSDGQE